MDVACKRFSVGVLGLHGVIEIIEGGWLATLAMLCLVSEGFPRKVSAGLTVIRVDEVVLDGVFIVAASIWV